MNSEDKMKNLRFSRPWSSGILVLLTIAAVAMLITAGHAAPAEPAAETTPAPATSPAEPEAKEFRGRLPMYYGQVVDDKQRQAVYAIQKEYFAEINELKAKLEALVKQRDVKVAAVLTPEQTAKVEQAKAAAKAKRDAKKSAAGS